MDPMFSCLHPLTLPRFHAGNKHQKQQRANNAQSYSTRLIKSCLSRYPLVLLNMSLVCRKNDPHHTERHAHTDQDLRNILTATDVAKLVRAKYFSNERAELRAALGEDLDIVRLVHAYPIAPVRHEQRLVRYKQPPTTLGIRY